MLLSGFIDVLGRYPLSPFSSQLWNSSWMRAAGLWGSELGPALMHAFCQDPKEDLERCHWASLFSPQCGHIEYICFSLLIVPLIGLMSVDGWAQLVRAARAQALTPGHCGSACRWTFHTRAPGPFDPFLTVPFLLLLEHAFIHLTLVECLFVSFIPYSGLKIFKKNVFPCSQRA